MAKKKSKGGGSDVLFRVGVESHPATSKTLSDLGNQITAVQSKIAGSMRDVARHVTSASDQVKREVELLHRGFGREQLSAFRAASDGAKSAIEATGAAVVGQIRSVVQSATDQMKQFANAQNRNSPQPSFTAATRGTPTGPVNRVDVVARNDAPTNLPPPSSTAVPTKEAETDRIKRILRDYGTWTAELDKRIRDIESGQADHGIAETQRMVDAKKRILASLPGSQPGPLGSPESPPSRSTPRGRSTRPVVSQAAQDEAGEDRYDNRQREQGILDRAREREREEKEIAKRTAQFKIEWSKKVENAQKAGLDGDIQFMQLSLREQESVLKKREALKKAYYAREAKMAAEAKKAEDRAAAVNEKKTENAKKVGLDGDPQFMNLSLREQEAVLKKREAMKKAYYANEKKMARESAAAEREAAASVAAAQMDAVAKAQAAQNKYTSSRRALMGSLAESTASVMQLARGIGMLGLVGEENMEDFVKGLAKLQGTFDIAVGGMQSIQRLSGVWSNLRGMMDAASAASAAGGAKSTAMTAALAREAVAANAAATAYMRLNAGRGGGGAAGAARNAVTGAAGQVATGAAGRVAGAAVTGVAGTAAAGATGPAATGAVATGAAGAGAGAATGSMTAATIGVPIAAAIAAVASSVLAGIVTKDFAKGISSSGLGGGMKHGSVGDGIATAEAKFIAAIDKIAAKTGLSSEARGTAIDAMIGPIGMLIPGLNGFGKAITDLTESSARLDRAEKFRADLIERIARKEADSKERAIRELETNRREMDLNRQRTEQRDDIAFQANDVKRFVANTDQEDKQSALDRQIANEKRSLENDRNPAEYAARSQKIAGLEKQKRDSGADFLSPEMLEKRELLIKKEKDAAEFLAKTRQFETDTMNSGGNIDDEIRKLDEQKRRLSNKEKLDDGEKKALDAAKASLDELIQKREQGNQKIKEADDRSIAARNQVLAIENEITKARLAASRMSIADLHREIELRGQIAEMEKGRIDSARQKFGQMDATDQKKLVLAAERVRKEGLEFDKTGLNKADRDKIGAAKTEYTAAQRELVESGDALKTLKSGKGNKFTDAQGELEAARDAQKKLLEKQAVEKKDVFGFDKKQSPESAKEQFAARQAAAKRLKDAQEKVRAVSAESRETMLDPDRKEKIKAAEERDAAAKERMAKAMSNRDMTQFDVAQTQQEKRKRDEQLKTISEKEKAGVAISPEEKRLKADAANRRLDAIAIGTSREDKNLLGASGLREGEDIQRRGFDQSAQSGGFDRVAGILGGGERARVNDADRNKRQLQDEVVAREGQNRNTVRDHEAKSRPAHQRLAEAIPVEVTTKTDVEIKIVPDDAEAVRKIVNAINENGDRRDEELVRKVMAELAATDRKNKEQQLIKNANNRAGLPR